MALGAIDAWGPAAAWAAAAAIFTLVTWRNNLFPAHVPAAIRVAGGCLFIDDQLAIERDQVSNGTIRPVESGRFRVTLQCRRRLSDVELDVDDVEQGRAILRELGAGAGIKRLSMRVASPIYGRPKTKFWAGLLPVVVTLLTFLALKIIDHSAWQATMGWAGILAAVFTSVGAFHVPARVDVGADGLLLAWFGRHRFVSMADIAGVRTGAVAEGSSRRSAVFLKLHDGEKVAVPVGIKGFEAGKSEALAQRIRDALQSYRSGHGEPSAFLGRNERSTAQWLHALQRLGLGVHGSHRQPAPDRDQLWRIAEDASSPELDRGAAVVALAAEGDEQTRKRLAEARGATASPRLRIVLDAAEEGAAEEELIAALDALDADEQLR